MPDDYKQALADLTGFIEERDELAKTLKLLPPEESKEGQRLLALFDEKIERCEQALAIEYEAHQKQCRAEENQDEIVEDMKLRMQMVYIYIKHRIPAKLEEITAALLNDYTPEEEQEFYDRVAILEATRLEEIIAEDKP